MLEALLTGFLIGIPIGVVVGFMLVVIQYLANSK